MRDAGRAPGRGHRDRGQGLPRRAGHRDPPAAFQPDHPVHHARLPPGGDRADRHLPAHRTGRAHLGEAQPHAAGPGTAAGAAERHPRLRHHRARRSLRPRPQVGGCPGHGEAAGPGGRGARERLRPQAHQHARSGQPPARLPHQREDDVSLGPGPPSAHPHPGPSGDGGNGREGAAQLLRRSRRAELPGPHRRQPGPRDGLHGPAQARRLRPPPAVPGEPRGAMDEAGADEPRRLRPGQLRRARRPLQPGPPRGEGAGRRQLCAPHPPPGLQGRPAPGPLRLHQRALRGRLPHPPEHPRLPVAGGPRQARGGHGGDPPHQPPAGHHRQRLRPPLHRALRPQLL